ncbi:MULTISPECIES: FAD-dependent monooxygenase [unclassified Ornithinimicrobium]|uniref:FAD-dependent monooxygenase n=1 Tax=unclassified Ornithinimicrobium TaxID=2615080 RepID=UPI003852C2E0
MRDKDVIVVGGGIGGLATALRLTQLGLTVRVLEQASEFGEVGAGLQIAPNCTRILDHLGLLEEVKSLGVLPDHMVMKDAVDGTVLTRLDLRDLEERYGYPYMVIHRSDLHGTLLRACERAGVELVNNACVTGYENVEDGAAAVTEGGRHEARLVVAADGIRSVARRLLADDEPVSSNYVAYRGAVPIDQVAELDVMDDAVVVFVGPGCHFVQYPLRQGEMFNQVAVFESPKALAGEEDWGTPDELDAAFAGMHENIQAGLPLMWRDRWWRMFDREPLPDWVAGRVVLLGDSAHAPLQYIAQGAIMAIEDAWVLGAHAEKQLAAGATGETVDWDPVVRAYSDVRTRHTARVTGTSRKWGELWHVEGRERELRNEILRARETGDYSFTDWLYGPTALTPQELPGMFTPIPVSEEGVRLATAGAPPP